MTHNASPQKGTQTTRYPAALPAAGVPTPTPFFDPAEKAKNALPDVPPANHGALPPPVTGPRDFSTGICDFYQSWLICADAYCCTYCIAGAHHNFLMNGQEGIFWPLCCGLFCVDVGLSAISPYLPSSLCFHTCFMRQAIRQRYNLHHVTPGELNSGGAVGESHSWESLTDFLTVCFCLFCAIAQHQREIILQGDWCGGVFSDRTSMTESPGEVYAV